ncbi:hypothetical protein Wxf_03073 [Armadillidium vulgare]|nr:hypothetical protein Wxf_03073 [Armadillidium vulgare] [Wolbachia endosymbiont of Armadillidium vulgare]
MGVLNKLCQTAFLIQLNFQSVGKENVELRYSQCPIMYRHSPFLLHFLYSTIYLFIQGIYASK